MTLRLLIKPHPRPLVIANLWLCGVLGRIQTFHTEHVECVRILLADSADFIDSVWFGCLITLELKCLAFDFSRIDSPTRIAFWDEHWLTAEEIFLSVLKLNTFSISCVTLLVSLVFLVEEFSHLPTSKMRIVPNIIRVMIIREVSPLIFNDLIVLSKRLSCLFCIRCIPLSRVHVRIIPILILFLNVEAVCSIPE